MTAKQIERHGRALAKRLAEMEKAAAGCQDEAEKMRLRWLYFHVREAKNALRKAYDVAAGA